MSTENSQTSTLETAIVTQAKQQVASVSVDGITTSFKGVNPIEADRYLNKKRAARNPLRCIGIFTVKPE